MRFLRLGGAPAPLAELLVVSMLFWTIVCGKATSELIGDILYHGCTLTGSLELQKREPRPTKLSTSNCRLAPESNSALVDLLLDHDRRVMGRKDRSPSGTGSRTKVAALSSH